MYALKALSSTYPKVILEEADERDFLVDVPSDRELDGEGRSG